MFKEINADFEFYEDRYGCVCVLYLKYKGCMNETHTHSVHAWVWVCVLAVCVVIVFVVFSMST